MSKRRRKSRSSAGKVILTAIVLLAVIAVALCLPHYRDIYTGLFGNTPNDDNGILTDLNDGGVRITFIDVGQGDSSFIEFPDNTCMLIDAGENEMASRVINLIRKRGYSKIDYVLVTHPHSDHMGGMPEVLKAFDIGKIYMPDAVTNTSIFSRLLDTIESKGLKVSRAKAGVIIKQTDDLEIRLLSPVQDEYENLNNYSAVCRIVYKSRSFLFMGDAEKLVEKELYMEDVLSDVVKIGHHGSSTSSGKSFVAATKAKYGILSLGEGNTYGHPNASVVKTWESFSAKLLRTDELGNIVFVTDGSKLSYYSEKSGAGENMPTSSAVTDDLLTPDYTYALNEGSRRVHTPDCSYVETISSKNLSFTSKTLDELKSEGYSLCSHCNPE